MAQTSVNYGMKRCLNCGALKPASEYHKNGAQKDGLQTWCKACIRESYDPKYQHDYYVTNKDVLLPRHNESARRHYRVKIIGMNEYAAHKLAEAWVEAVIEKARKEEGICQSL